jgi:hypothetical protein
MAGSDPEDPMRSRLTPLALLLLFALDGPAYASRDGIGFTTNFDGDKPTITCDDIDMKFWKERKGDLVTARHDETVSLSFSGTTAFRLRAAEQGGIRVQPSSGPSASVVVCMAAGATSQAAAETILDRIHVVNSGGELSVNGPDGENWAAYLIVSVPKGVALDLQAENGGLGLVGVSGRFTLRTVNGPISISDVSGQVDAEASNGPISFSGHEGIVRLAAENGPISVKLDAPTFSGKALEASTQNGPVSLTAPADFRTGVEVEGAGNSPFQVNGGNLVRAGEIGWGRPRTARFGQGPVLVRLSTVNGPVNINGPSLKSDRPEKRPTKGDEI